MRGVGDESAGLRDVARRRPDKDVLALRADQKDAHHATVGIILSSA